MQMIKLLFQVSLAASLLFTGCSGEGSEISPSAQVVEESFAPQPLPTIIQIPRRSFQECLEALNRNNSPHKGPDLGRCDLAASDLANTDLRFANLMDADLRFAVLKNANLSDSVLAGADLSWADLRRANLSCTGVSCVLNRFIKLVGADLRGANLVDANLYAADLSGANLLGADLTDATLIDTIFCGTTMPDGSTNDEGC
jgi:uncharacterized protein YjbI with pentapeptide repeats